MCKACDLPQRAALEQDIRGGMPPGPAAKKYGLKPAGVVAHERLHMGRIPAKIQPINPERLSSPLDPVLAQIEVSHTPAIILPVNNESSEDCSCYWCQMSDYQRLLKAWEAASRLEKDRFCATTREYDVPF